jgi:hypothetical protein
VLGEPCFSAKPGVKRVVEKPVEMVLPVQVGFSTLANVAYFAAWRETCPAQTQVDFAPGRKARKEACQLPVLTTPQTLPSLGILV